MPGCTIDTWSRIIMFTYTQKIAKEVKKKAQSAIITLKAIESLTYKCSDYVFIKELNTKLTHLMDEFQSKLPAADGLAFRSAIKEQTKQAEKCIQNISTLPAYKPRDRKRMDSAYRNRVGKHTDALCKVHVHNM